MNINNYIRLRISGLNLTDIDANKLEYTTNRDINNMLKDFIDTFSLECVQTLELGDWYCSIALFIESIGKDLIINIWQYNKEFS